MQVTRPALAVVLAALWLFTACAPPASPPSTSSVGTERDPHATGLRPPTAEEAARLEAIAKKNPSLTPNELARERLNAERKAKDLPPLPAETAVPPPSVPLK